MTSDFSHRPQAGKYDKVVQQSFFRAVLKSLSGGRVVVVLAVIAVGVILGLSAPHALFHVALAPQVEQPQSENTSLDKALVQGVGAALPIAPGELSRSTVISTVPTTAANVSQIEFEKAVAKQNSEAPAYLVATANAEGLRLKTIVTR